MPGAPVPQLESDRLRLRPWQPSDVRPFAVIVNDPEVMRHMGTGVRYRAKRRVAAALARVSDIEARRAIATVERQWERLGFGEWAVEEKASGALIGKIGLVHHPDWPADPAKIEIGWILARSAWGHGFATEGARVALDHAFSELELPRVISIARCDNERSHRVMERLGLRREGTTRWRGSDMLWYAVDRTAWRGT